MTKLKDEATICHAILLPRDCRGLKPSRQIKPFVRGLRDLRIRGSKMMKYAEIANALCLHYKPNYNQQRMSSLHRNNSASSSVNTQQESQILSSQHVPISRKYQTLSETFNQKIQMQIFKRLVGCMPARNALSCCGFLANYFPLFF